MQLSFYIFAICANANVLSGLNGMQILKVGECGQHGDVNYGACDDRYNGQYPCCSQYGYCGGNEQYCGSGCQAGYSLNGKCQVPAPAGTTTPAPTPTAASELCAPRLNDYNDELHQCYVATHRDGCPCDERSVNLLKGAIAACGSNNPDIIQANDNVKQSCHFSVL